MNREEVQAIGTKSNVWFKTRHITYMALFVALIAIGAFIKIPIPVLPFTLQFLFTMLAGLLLGGKNGAICVATYIALGLLGLPIFAEGGGFLYLLKSTFGYLVGFCVASYVIGSLAERTDNHSVKNVSLYNFIGLFIVYSVGMVYYYIICNYVINTPIALWPLFLYGFILAVPGDIFLCFLAAILNKRLRLVLQNVG